MTLKICFLDRATIRDDIKIRSPNFEHTWVEYQKTPVDKVIERIADADIVITNKVAINDKILASCPNIKMIAVAATGLDIIDLVACEKRTIVVTNIQNYALTTVPEHVITVMLMLKRQIVQYQNEVIKGRWQAENNFCFFDKPINDISKSTLGLIGFGALGQATAKLAVKLGMKVKFYNRSDRKSDLAEQVDLNTIITESDIISCHCALTPETHHLLSDEEFDAMKPSAFVINTARGAIIDELALANAIKNHKIAGAAIDVLPQEPPEKNSPLMQIATQSNVILTPHIAWASQQAMQGLVDQLIDNIEQFGTH